MSRSDKPRDLDALRRRAETILEQRQGRIEGMPRRDIETLLHELGTYQIELEMQNEELRRAQQANEESRRRYSDLYDFAPVGYFTLDPDGTVREVNLTGAQMLGVARSLIVGSPRAFHRFVAAEDRAVFAQHQTATFAGEGRQSCELVLRRDDGKRFHAQLQSIASEQDGRRWMRTAVSDVTRLKEAEAEETRARAAELVARQEAETQRIQRLEQLRILAAGIAHDLNNLMVAVRANAELALKALQPGHPAWEKVQGIERGVEKVSGLSRQILGYAGRNAIAKEPVDLNQLVQDTARLLMASISSKAQLTLALASGLPTIAVDPQGIQQILVNLVTNAADALRGQTGNVRIATGRVWMQRARLEHLVLGETLPEGDYVYFEVADTGSGMDPETRRRVFEPFFTTKAAGRGLGLSVVQGLVRAHGGTIEVESEAGVGTRVRVLLSSPEHELAAPARERSDGSFWEGTGTLLLVDDDQDVLEMTKAVLEQAGYGVLTATSGEEALETFARKEGEISAVVLDFLMPRMKGDELIRRLGAVARDLKVVLVTGYHDVELHGLETEHCRVRLLQKPYRVDDLLQKVHELAHA